jgi:asparagine synthase (glutamine-hydrolysing)
MCGIIALVNLKDSAATEVMEKSTSIIQYRGPDDEGFLLWDGIGDPKVFSGKDTHVDTITSHELQSLPETYNWNVGFGHRRLSIIDTTPLGHQPMQFKVHGLSITYNGEIYNYVEIKEKLIQKGHTFLTHSDTEVILHAWAEWGKACLHKFNGMFAFVLLDTNKNKLYAVRDRFGIKPLYYSHTNEFISFASEIKQIRSLPEFTQDLNKDICYDYLAHGLLDHTSQTFDTNIFQLRGGELAIVDLNESVKEVKVERWYTLKPKKWKGTKEEAETQFRALFKDSVRLRLRADVSVGSCLSGGLDSSAIVCQVADLLKDCDSKGQETVTACFKESKYDEWKFAEQVIKKVNANAHQVWPSSDKLIKEIDKLIWHMDEPFGSTSQFSQWCVFEGAAKTNLKVMLDGQGADELLAGYGGNDVPLYTGLLKKGKINNFVNEYKGFKQEHGYSPRGQMLHAFKRTFHLEQRKENTPVWLDLDKQTSSFLPFTYSLQEEMIKQLTTTSIPALLRYEDRNSMAFGIESRVPFLDYRLVEFLLGLPEEFIYHLGVRKVILRNALQKLVPESILKRRDKMGFVTPEELWLKEEKTDWFINGINPENIKPEWIHKENLQEMVNQMIEGEIAFTFEPWRVLCFHRWLSRAS